MRENYERSAFRVHLEFVKDRPELDSFHHMINVISVCFLSAGVDMKFSVFAYSCFLSSSKRLFHEQDVLKNNFADLNDVQNSVFLCKKYKDNDSLISFHVAGEVRDNTSLMDAISFCMAAAEEIGKKSIQNLFKA